jgi:hypothetical protein
MSVFIGMIGAIAAWFGLAVIFGELFFPDILLPLLGISGALCLGLVFFRRLRNLAQGILVGTLVAALPSVLIANEAAYKFSGFTSRDEYSQAQKMGLKTPADFNRRKKEDAEAAQKAKERAQEAKERAQKEKEAALQAEKQRKAEAEASCRADLKCFIESEMRYANAYCPEYVERLAKYSHEWTNGWLSSKFTRWKWKDQSKRQVTFLGDQIKLQNGFGAWAVHIYECDWDTATQTVLGVRVRPGRFPL